MAKTNATKNFVLRVDADTMAAIEAWAADEFRSTNGQLQWIIAEALKRSGRLRKGKVVRKTTTLDEAEVKSAEETLGSELPSATTPKRGRTSIKPASSPSEEVPITDE